MLCGISYFGFETEKYYPHGLWSFDLNFFLDFIKVWFLRLICLTIVIDFIFRVMFHRCVIFYRWSLSLQNNGFNAIRVPFSLELVKNNPGGLDINCNANPGLCGLSALQVLDAFIDR